MKYAININQPEESHQQSQRDALKRVKEYRRRHGNKPMGTYLDYFLMEQLRISANEARFFNAIDDLSNNTKYPWCKESMLELSDYLGISVNTITNYLKDGVEKNLVVYPEGAKRRPEKGERKDTRVRTTLKYTAMRKRGKIFIPMSLLHIVKPSRFRNLSSADHEIDVQKPSSKNCETRDKTERFHKNCEMISQKLGNDFTKIGSNTSTYKYIVLPSGEIEVDLGKYGKRTFDASVVAGKEEDIPLCIYYLQTYEKRCGKEIENPEALFIKSMQGNWYERVRKEYERQEVLLETGNDPRLKDVQTLISKLIPDRYHEKAKKLVLKYGVENVGNQLRYLKYIKSNKKAQISRPYGWLRGSLEQDYAGEDEEYQKIVEKKTRWERIERQREERRRNQIENIGDTINEAMENIRRKHTFKYQKSDDPKLAEIGQYEKIDLGSRLDADLERVLKSWADFGRNGANHDQKFLLYDATDEIERIMKGAFGESDLPNATKNCKEIINKVNEQLGIAA